MRKAETEGWKRGWCYTRGLDTGCLVTFTGEQMIKWIASGQPRMGCSPDRIIIPRAHRSGG